MANDKPLIRHCWNCEWGKPCCAVDGAYCNVRYKYIYLPRPMSWFCRFFKMKGGNGNA